jgi:single-strand DNA-binding protein
MLNVTILTGRLVADPELRTTQNGVSVTQFTIAVDRGYVKQGEEKQTDFFDVVCWRSTAEFVCKYFNKGNLISVQGMLRTRSYTDKEGNKRKVTEVLAEQVHFTESKKQSDSGNQQPTYAPPQPYSNGTQAEFEEVVTDDDLPF